jgi:HEAT repeat protein
MHMISLRTATFFGSIACLLLAMAAPDSQAAEPGKAELGQADAVSVPQLIKNLDSDSQRVASSAARSLGVIFAPGGKGGDDLGKITDMLIARLESPKGAELRKESATALGNMRAAKASEGLKRAMGDEDIDVAMAAGEAVGQILPVDEARAFLIGRGSDGTEAVQVAAYHGLAPISKPEDAPFLIKGLTSKNWRAQLDAVRGLERAVHAGAKVPPETYDAVAAVFGNEVVNPADAAMHFFLTVRTDESLKAVLKAADTGGEASDAGQAWRTRAYALRTIFHLGWPTTRDALPVVMRQLGDPTANVSNEAKRILITLRKEHLMSQADLFPLLLIELEKAEPLSMRAGIMEEMGDQVDRQYASRVAKAASQTLKAAADEKPQWAARAHSANLVRASGYTGVMDVLAACVADDVTNVRQSAGRALEELAPLCSPEQRAPVAPLLLPLLVKPVDWHKTAVAAHNVGYYATPECVEPLLLLLSHSVLNVREGASHSLVVMASGDDKALRAAVDGAIYSELAGNQKAWEYGAPVLGALLDIKAIPQLTSILDRGDWRCQASAAEAVARIAGEHKLNNKALSDALIKAAQSKTLQTQDAANKALRALNQEETEGS